MNVEKHRIPANTVLSIYSALPPLPKGESAEALPVADEARRFRGSAPIGGRVSVRQSAGATVDKVILPQVKSGGYAPPHASTFIAPPHHGILMVGTPKGSLNSAPSGAAAVTSR